MEQRLLPFTNAEETIAKWAPGDAQPCLDGLARRRASPRLAGAVRALDSLTR